jgi:hypothetical protein
MSKIYFVVGIPGTGLTHVVTSLLSIYSKNNQTAVISRLGIPERIKNSGTKTPTETLFLIDNQLGINESSDAVIFMGWRIADHINEIYSEHPNATFIFTDSNLDDRLRRKGFEIFATLEEVENVMSNQKLIIDSFIANNSLDLTWHQVDDQMFNPDKSLNLSTTGTIKIAIISSI